MFKNKTHHMQTPEGKQAATEARRKWALEQPPKGAPVVFVIRLDEGEQPFGWEIRKYGSFVLSRSETGFGTQLLAQMAGETALTALMTA